MTDTLVGQLPHEEALAARAQVDRAAFALVYDHFYQRVYNYVRYRVRHREAAEDVTAQVFERTLRHLSEYRPDRAPFAAWLFSIARHAVIDHLRGQERHPELPLESVENQPGDHLSPGEQVEEAQIRARILALVARLAEREREIIALKFGAGLTNRQIAELIGLTESNVGVILYRTIRVLRRALGQEDERGSE